MANGVGVIPSELPSELPSHRLGLSIPPIWPHTGDPIKRASSSAAAGRAVLSQKEQPCQSDPGTNPLLDAPLKAPRCQRPC